MYLMEAKCTSCGVHYKESQGCIPFRLRSIGLAARCMCMGIIMISLGNTIMISGNQIPGNHIIHRPKWIIYIMEASVYKISLPSVEGRLGYNQPVYI